MKEYLVELRWSNLKSLIRFIQKLSKKLIEESIMWEITCEDDECPTYKEVRDVLQKLVNHNDDNSSLKLTLRDIDILCDLGDNFVEIEFMSGICRKFYKENEKIIEEHQTFSKVTNIMNESPTQRVKDMVDQNFKNLKNMNDIMKFYQFVQNGNTIWITKDNLEFTRVTNVDLDKLGEVISLVRKMIDLKENHLSITFKTLKELYELNNQFNFVKIDKSQFINRWDSLRPVC